MLKPLASWNSQLRVWTIEKESLFSEHLELFQEVLPKSGMTAAGRLFELQTQGRLTSESESLSSPTLPTPTTQDNSGKCRDHGGDLLHEVVCGCERSERRLLPTPTVFHLTMNDEPIETFLEREKRSSTGQIGKSLGVALRIELFRTPTTTNATAGAVSEKRALERGTTVKTQDQIAQLAFENGLKVPDSITEQLTLIPTTRVSMAKGATAREVAEGNPKSRIEAEVLLGETNWGKFALAIERWEKVSGRKAPAPTKPDGKDGSHRLSSLFTEWLMGLPLGWITGHNLSRAEELKMAGNGVVPQQAEMALRFLIDDENFV